MNKLVSGLLLASAVFAVGCQEKESVASTSEMKSSAVEQKVTPMLLASAEGMKIYRHEGRVYVVSEAMAKKFSDNGHLPYAKTKIGEGPLGETLVFEINPKDDSLGQMLMKKYEDTPVLLKQQGEDFYAFSKAGRLVMIGSKEMAEKFQSHGHLPYAKTLIGAGPQGQTLVYEIDKKNPEVTEKLMMDYKKIFM